jgi:hypothetical protein
MLLSEDVKRLDKNRELILNQVTASQQIIQRTPPFMGDSALRNDYGRILDLYHTTYTTVYDQMMILREKMNESADAFRSYQDAVENLEGLLDDAEEKWERNETYFSSKFNLNVTPDPMLDEVNFLREFSAYVQEIRSSTLEMGFQVKKMQNEVKAKNYKVLEDLRKAMVKSSEKAQVRITRTGPYLTNDEKEDSFLSDAALNYLDYCRRTLEVSVYQELMLLDEAIYDDSPSQTEKSITRLSRMLEDMNRSEADFKKRLDKFVGAYVKE